MPQNEFEEEERKATNLLKDIFAGAKQADPKTIEILSQLNTALCNL